jgi:hypothetical protein
MGIFMHGRSKGGSHVTDRIIGVAICLLALSVLAVPSKAQALPVLLTVQSTQVSIGHGWYDSAVEGLHALGFRGNWTGLIPWRGGGGSLSSASFSGVGGGAGGFAGSAGGGAAGSASGFAGSASGSGGSASGFAGSANGLASGFSASGAGPYVTVIVNLWWDSNFSNWTAHRPEIGSSGTTARVNPVNTTGSASSVKVPEPASALMFAAGALIVLRSATRRQRRN